MGEWYTRRMAKKAKKVAAKKDAKKTLKSIPVTKVPPIKYWSHSSLLSFLRNPLAWHKRYVDKIYDTPSGASAVVGRAGHIALQHFYSGINKDGSIQLGLEYLRDVPDFEINFGVARTEAEKKKKRENMEREYLQAMVFYLEKPPKHKVVGVEEVGMAHIPGHVLPIKAVSDLVVQSPLNKKALDIVDHKFVDSFSPGGKDKTLFILQAIFNYYTVREKFKKPILRFILYECKKRRNADGSPQMRKYIIDYREAAEGFEVFHRLLQQATEEIMRERHYLPNPSDMFEGENSFDIYRLNLGN